MTLPDFDEAVLALCDELWVSGERLAGSTLFLAAFAGPAAERPGRTLASLTALREDRDLADRLYLDAHLDPLIAQLRVDLDGPAPPSLRLLPGTDATS